MKTVITKVQKWGNSQGIRLSKELLYEADIDVGDTVKVVGSRGRLIVTPVCTVQRRYDLDKRVKRIPKDYESEELDWGSRGLVGGGCGFSWSSSTRALAKSVAFSRF
ncbi:MAG TPA: transcriptional regulator/antitoxin, MazE [Vicinamibacteria bacterium]|nr:transcriptional regulator/antitoxin, MazE [Vicinamibacteria bacterium]